MPTINLMVSYTSDLDQGLQPPKSFYGATKMQLQIPLCPQSFM